jgi:hypothetical protein
MLCTVGAKDTYTYKLVKPSGEPVEEYVYPNLAKNYGYKIVLSPSPNGFSKGVFKVTLTNGKFSDGKPENPNVQANEIFTVTWDDVSNATGTVKISMATPSDTSATILKAGTPIQMSHKIASLKGQTPEMSVSSNPPMGSKQTITAQITTEATYPNIQESSVTEGTINKRAEYYEWTLPANWTAAGQNGNTFIIGAQQKSITITPDNVTSGAVKIRALNSAKTAGSETRSNTLDRGFAITAFPPSINIGDNSPKTFSTTLFNGITYEWSTPSEWKINGQGNILESLNMNSVNITPAFCSFGDMMVRVRIKKDGDVSSWYDFPYYKGIAQPTISSNTQTVYQYEDVNFSLSNISVAGVNSVTWSGDGVLVLNNQGLNSEIVFTKSDTIVLNVIILMNGCSIPIALPISVVVNPGRLLTSGPSSICTQATFTVNSSSGASSGCTVSWRKSNNLSYDNQSGNPKVFTANGSGAGWVEATISLGAYGTLTLPRQDVWVGTPTNNNINFGVFFSNPPNDKVPRNQNTKIGVVSNPDASAQGVTGYQWQFMSWEPYIRYYETYQGYANGVANILLNSNAPSLQIVQVSAVNACGCDWDMGAGKMLYAVSGYYMSISPNPVSDEAIIELSSTSEEKASETPEWAVEVFSPGQLLNAKTPKMKTKTHKINTQGWQNGVYIVRATVEGKIVTGKLVVKK